jgi:hypothetical protein
MKPKRLKVFVCLFLVFAYFSACSHTEERVADQPDTPVSDQASTSRAAPEGDQSSHQTPMGVVGDLLIMRPLGLIETIGCGLFYLVTLPFTAIAGNHQEVYQNLVVKPYKYTFERPIGHFYYKSESQSILRKD